ncbi:hypothetical protein diail_8771 [Diaporthe ilicicola]|nr:hypothetical protein diail_8771 [Diaporthe ilicicola]
MCFSELIGYTCGHSSPEVLRPCPMTTQFYTNPVCTQHARRPILAPEMCPACQRVIHGRAVLITEWEHRWMHERGVCGCEVQFPDLIRPRVVSRSRPRQTIGNNGQAQNNGIASISLPEAGGRSMAGTKKVPAQYQERSTKAGEDKPEVAVRIPSLYGAEWVNEHRQLHRDGSCKCAGEFSFYKTPEPYQIVPSTSALVEHGSKQVVQTKTIQASQGESRRNSQNSVSSFYFNPQDRHQDTFYNSDPLILSHHHYHQTGNMAQQSPYETASLNQAMQRLAISHNQGSVPATPKPPLVVSSTWPFTTQPQRSPGAIYDVDPTKSSNKLYNLACNEGANISGLADCQSIEFPRPEGTLPLVGLPIGAGPEGPPGFSHVGTFQDCVLHTKNLIACLGDGPCLLAMKSKSFSCLRELTGGDERLDQQAPALARAQSNNCSSSESCGCGQSSADEDQLFLG